MCLVQDDAADDLHRVGAHAQHPPVGLPAGGESLGQDVVQGLALLEALFEFTGLGLELVVAEGLVLLLQGQDLVHQRHDGLDLPLGAGAEDLFEYVHIAIHLNADADLSNISGENGASAHDHLSIPHPTGRKKSKL